MKVYRSFLQLIFVGLLVVWLCPSVTLAEEPTKDAVDEEAPRDPTPAQMMENAKPVAKPTPESMVMESYDLTLEQAIQEALANNQELKAKRQELESAKAQLLKAVWPNPELESGLETSALTGSEGQDKWDVGFSLTIPLSGRLGHQKRAANRLIERATWDIQDAERLLTLKVTRAFTQVVAIQEQLKVLDVLIQLNRKLSETAEARFGQGEVSQTEVQISEVELRQDLVEQKRLQAEYKISTSALNLLMGRPPSTTPSVVMGKLDYKPITLDLDQLTQWALDHRPDVKSLDAAIQQGEALVNLAKAKRLQDLKVSSFYQGSENPEDDNLIGFRFSLPLPIFDRKKGDIKEAVAQQQTAEITKEFIDLRVEREVEQLVAQLTALQEVVGSYKEEILTTLESSIQTIQDAYAQGQVGFFEVIQIEERLVNFKRSYVEALTNYVTTRAELTTALGGTWPEMAVDNTIGPNGRPE